MSSPAKGSTARRGGRSEAAGWELRPGGMLVQQRNSGPNTSSVTIPTIKIIVKYGPSSHEIHISSQASFGELKKMVAGPTGLQPQEQKLIYKDRERDSKAFLDRSGVKDGSKVVLVEDVMARETRCLEMRKNAKMDKASKEIKEVSLEVDKVVKQVASLESEICGGKKVVEASLLNIIELLMTQLIKLDGIVANGDEKLERRTQVKRVQKYIEILDMLKIRNSMVPLQKQPKISTGQTPIPLQKQQEQRNLTGNMPGRPVVVTKKWETF